MSTISSNNNTSLSSLSHPASDLESQPTHIPGLTPEDTEIKATFIVSPKIFFSLSSAPPFCRIHKWYALFAMQKNGLEYEMLCDELKKDIGIVKLSVLSVLKTNPKDIDLLLTLIPQETRNTNFTQNIEFYHARKNNRFGQVEKN